LVKTGPLFFCHAQITGWKGEQRTRPRGRRRGSLEHPPMRLLRLHGNGFPLMLSVDKVGRRVGRLQILENISFEWARGVLAVIGGNGTGKTTLLRIVAGASKPDAGHALWNGVP